MNAIRRGSTSATVARRAIAPSDIAFCVVLAIAMFVGGGVTDFGIALFVQLLAACVLLGTQIYRYGRRFLSTPVRKPEAILAVAALGLPLAQLIPLPPIIWANLPGREIAFAIRSAFGRESGWFPLTLSPADTLPTVFAVVIVLTVAIAATRLTVRGQRAAFEVMIGVAFASVVVGTVQLASGGSTFDFHESNYGSILTGFLANRNHAGVFLAAMIPLFVHLVYTSRLKGAGRAVAAIAGSGMLFAAAIGTGSRSGFVFCLIASAYALLLLARSGQINVKGRGTLLVGVALVLVVAVIASSTRTVGLVERFGDATDDLRWTIWATSAETAAHYWPIGSGFGTFINAYHGFEHFKDLAPEYINNAHNDYLELALEAGLAGVALVGAAIVLIVIRTASILRHDFGSGIASTRLAALAFPWLVAFHSIVDYPMRRMAIAVPVIVLLAIAFRKVGSVQGIEPTQNLKSR